MEALAVQKAREMTLGELKRHYSRLIANKTIIMEDYEKIIRRLAIYCKPDTENGSTSLHSTEDVATSVEVPSTGQEGRSENVSDDWDITDESKVYTPNECIMLLNENFDKATSQKQRLAEFLSDNEWHDTPSIVSSVYGNQHLGLSRLSARILDLKHDGHIIESRRKKGSIWEYRMIS